MSVLRLYQLGLRWLPRLPEPLIYGVCELIGWLVLLLLPTTRRAVLANLAQVQPRRRALSRWLLAQQVIANVNKYYADLLRLPSMPAAERRRRFEITGLDYLELVLAQGRGAVVAVPHCGSYSLAMAVFADLGFELALVVERVEPPELLELLTGLRGRANVQIIVLGPEAGRELVRALRRNKLLVLASDRGLAQQCVSVPFFGRPARIPAGPAQLALRGVPLLTAFGCRLPGGRGIIRVNPPLSRAASTQQSVADLTRRMVAELEEYIGRFPESWIVLQPVWPAADSTRGEL